MTTETHDVSKDEGSPDWATLPLPRTVLHEDQKYIYSAETRSVRGDDPDLGSRRPQL